MSTQEMKKCAWSGCGFHPLAMFKEKHNGERGKMCEFHRAKLAAYTEKHRAANFAAVKASNALGRKTDKQKARIKLGKKRQASKISKRRKVDPAYALQLDLAVLASALFSGRQGRSYIFLQHTSFASKAAFLAHFDACLAAVGKTRADYGHGVCDVGEGGWHRLDEAVVGDPSPRRWEEGEEAEDWRVEGGEGPLEGLATGPVMCSQR